MNFLHNRASGILMHISSLPGPGGIGTLGASAYTFVDYLANAKQSYWQILPICPTSYGDSPYQSFSTYAGNPYFIDLELLQKDGLLNEADWKHTHWANDERFVDYGVLYIERHKLLRAVHQKFEQNLPTDFEIFCKENSFWLEDYALFMAIKDKHGGISFHQWEEDIRTRNPESLANWKNICYNDIRYYKMLQYLFFKQWKSLKQYANKKGIRIIGDLPIYVSSDSSDVWANPEIFDTKEVAGCPPDAFAADGQLWGNPVYKWDVLEKQNYQWWITRLTYNLAIYDVLRIDHFRGFESYYCIPAQDTTAKNGVWRKGPGLQLFTEFKKHAPDAAVIAEDLGFLTDEVKQMRKDSGFPGMKVLQFAFDSREENDYLPEHYEHTSVVYTGTHDNDTLLGWINHSPKEDIDTALKYLHVNNQGQLAPAMMKAAMECVSDTCILTMQDILGLETFARMNIPSTLGNNWRWRATEKQLAEAPWNKLRSLTEQTKRC